MFSPIVHRLALVLVVATLALIASGPASLGVHRGLTVVVGLSALAIAVLSKHRWAWINFGIIIAEGGLARLAKISPWGAAAHDCLGPISLSLACALAVLSGSSGNVEKVEDSGSPSLEKLARLTPAVILVQVMLGSLYRHDITGVAYHVVGAMLVGGLIMFAGISAMILPAAPKPLLRAATALLSVTVLQFFFGIYAYISRISNETASAVAISHIVTGALTMGLSVVLALLVFRFVRPASAVPA